MKKAITHFLSVLTLSLFSLTVFSQTMVSESFDGATFPPAGWQNLQVSGTGLWNRSTSGTNPTCTTHSGAGMARYYCYNYSSGTAANLVSPNVDFSSRGTNAATVSFWMFRDNLSTYGTSDKVEVYVNTAANTTGATLLGTIFRYYNTAPTATANTWNKYTFNIPADFTTASNYLIFKAISGYGYNIFVDDITVEVALPVPPSCASISSPADAGTDITLSATLNWSAGSGAPTGYKLYLGTDNPPTNIVNGTDLGNVTTYTPSPALSYSTTYYWKVIPYNQHGDATGCAVWSFTTLADPAIYSLPYTQGFELATFPPNGWTNLKTAGSGTGLWTRHTTGTYPTCNPHGGTAMTSFQCFSYSAGTKGILVSPKIEVASSAVLVQFWMYRDAGYATTADQVNVYVNTSDNLTGATLLGTINRSTTLAPVETVTGWYQYAFAFSNSTPGAKFVIFEGVSAYGNNMFIDDISLLEPAMVSGIVKDGISGNPLEGALVKIDPSGPLATTLADGSYNLLTLPGTFDISCTALGYAKQTVNTTLAPGANTLDFNMEALIPPLGLTATVVLKDVNLGWTAPSYFPAKENLTYPKPVNPEYLPAVPGQIPEDVDSEPIVKENILPQGILPPQENGSKGLLYDNGPYLTGTCATSGAPESMGYNTTTGFNFNINANITIADDFIIPAGETWKLTELEYLAYQTNSGPNTTITGAFARIWNGNPMTGGQVIWGDLTTNLMASTSFTGQYRVGLNSTCNTQRPLMKVIAALPNLVLTEGTYWLELAATGSLASGPWTLPVTIPGQTVTGNAVQYVGGAWQNLEIGAGTGNIQGIPFLIKGSMATPAANLAGYKVYRDGAFLADVDASKTEYADGNLLPATYSYEVSAVYTAPTEGESFKAGPVEAIVYGCQRPQNLTAINLTPHSADLDWTEVGEATEWVVEWGLAGFIQGEGTLIEGITAHPYTLTGLDFPVSYSFYVKAICTDDESIWSGPYTFTTPCDTWTVPFAEDFTGLPTGTGMPLCWVKAGTGASNWTVSNTAMAGGTAPELKLYWSPQFNGVSIVATPYINTVGLDQLILSFKHYFDDYDGAGAIAVVTNSDDNTTWNVVWLYDPELDSPLGPETLNLVVETPDVGASTFRIGFAYAGDSFNLDNWYIDDMILTLPPTLDPNPAAFNFNMMPGDAVEEVITVTNNGLWPVSYTVAFESAKASEWVILSDTEGYLEPAGSKEIGVSFKSSDLEPGLYQGNIVFTPDPAIGNVNVPINVQVLSMLSGVVYDANTNLPVAGAEVTIEGFDPIYSDPDGSYSLWCQVGTYDASVKMTGYCDLFVADINVSGYNFIQDFYLTAPLLVAIPNPVIKGLDLANPAGIFEIVLQNTGTCDLVFNASEIVKSGSWLSFSPDNGAIPAGGELPMTLTFNGTGFPSGIYETGILFDLEIIADLTLPVKMVIGDQTVYFENQFGASVSGWSGISTNHLPGTKAGVEEILGPYLEQMVIMLSREGIYWPEHGINTIGEWNPYEGYKFKFAQPMSIVFTGPEVFPKTVELPEGVSFVPVLSDLPVPVSVLNPVLPNMLYLFDIYNLKYNWPAGGINQIDFLEPGLAYLINLTIPGTINFPSKSATGLNNYKPLVNNTTWNNVTNTGSYHMISVFKSALSKLESGDYIGIFNNEGLCLGMAQYTDNANLALIAFGDDITTTETDGLQSGEQMHFRVFRSGEEFGVEPVFDPARPNFSGNFEENGLSAIIDFKMGVTSIHENPLNSITVYPNPSNGIFNINLNGMENVEISVTNTQGQLIDRVVIADLYQLNLSQQPKGVYFIKFLNGGQLRIEKLVIR